MRPSNRRDTAIVILFSAFCSILFLAVLEIGLRTTHLFGARISYSEPDSLLGYRFTPNSVYWNNKENDHPINGRINSFGWRDKERSIANPSGTYRVAIIGDSYVEASQVELDSTFMVLAENQLRSSTSHKVELINFGRSGVTQTEELLVLKHNVSAFSPDLVILFFLPSNDIDDISRKTACTTLRPFFIPSQDGQLTLDTSFNRSREYKLKVLINAIKQKSALVSLIAERFNYLQKLRRKRAIPTRQNSHHGIGGYLSLCTKSPDPTYVDNYSLNKTLIKNMAEYCNHENIRFMLFCIDSIYKSEEIERLKLIDPTFNEDFFDSDLHQFSTSLGIEYQGIEKPFKQFYRREKKSLHWAHWNYIGHRLVAKVLCQRIEALLSK